jgi:hypothetical protein
MDRKTLETKKISELRTIAQTLGIENSESLKKPELINSIAGNESSPIEEKKVTEPVQVSEEKIARPVRTVRGADSEGIVKNERKPRIRQIVETPAAAETQAETTVEATTEAPSEAKKPVHRHERGERTNTPNDGTSNQQNRRDNNRQQNQNQNQNQNQKENIYLRMEPKFVWKVSRIMILLPMMMTIAQYIL